MSSTTPPSFAVECVCGAWARGERQRKPQLLTCTGCGRTLFIFPAAASIFGATDPLPAPEWQKHLRFWIGPAAAAMLAIAVVGFVIAAIVGSRRGVDPSNADVSEIRATSILTDRLTAARAALEEGSYRLARDELDADAKLLSRHPAALSLEQARQFVRWRRQADLLADLLPESIGEIVTHSVGRAEREWESIFHERYAGKSLVLDTYVSRTAIGRYDVDYRLEAAGAVGEWDFDGLRLFETLPLQQPRRLFFGFRLRSIRRLARDRWSVIPEPESGVLLTDPIMLNGLSLPADEALNEVMRRQLKWESDG